MKIVNIMVLLAGLSTTACSMAQTMEKPPKEALEAKGEAVVWYDGDKRRTSRVMPGLVAEFAGQDDIQTKSVPATTGAPVLSERGVSIWKVDSTAYSTKAAQTLPRNHSPVFKDGGSMRALPGGVVVILNPSLTQLEVEQWFESQQLEIANQLTFAKYAYLVSTDAGLAALNVANRLVEESDKQIVISVTPNWWVRRSKR